MRRAVLFDVFGTLVHFGVKAHPFMTLMKDLPLNREQSLRARRLLLASAVPSIRHAANSLVSAGRDWLAGAGGALDMSFFSATGRVEGRFNSFRTEWLIQAYARTVVTIGPLGRAVLKGRAPASSAVWKILANEGATRALAFEGVETRQREADSE
ncbi:MAG: hypothetical protein JKY65_33425 [Planctomycetes bacterium]|nr:hypothetical protein [Planctomycetota bacterium]